ncbi:MAG: hypothetical protein WAR37_03360 [Candidatus Microsaccharimonas sp.]
MNKQKFLYHASPDIDIKVFEPRNEHPRYEGEENLVFATPDKQVAAMFLVPRSIPAVIGKYGNSHAVFVRSDRHTFELHDKPGAIYTLPSETFRTGSEIGMGESEWISREAVRPVKKTIYNSALEALKDNNIKIYFLDEDMFNKVKLNPSKGLEIVKE